MNRWLWLRLVRRWLSSPPTRRRRRTHRPSFFSLSMGRRFSLSFFPGVGDRRVSPRGAGRAVRRPWASRQGKTTAHRQRPRERYARTFSVSGGAIPALILLHPGAKYP
jgi:hypothetical protein